jgi:hypothetical protein
VQGGGHAVRGEGADLGGQVGGVVDDLCLAAGQVDDQVGLGAGTCGGDDAGAAGCGVLDGDRADPAGRADHQHVFAFCGADTFDRGERGGAGQAQGASLGDREAGGDRGQATRGGHRDVVSERTRAQERLRHHPEHLVADGVAGHALTQGGHSAGEVLADHQREAVLHHALQVAGGGSDVETVDRGGGHLHQHLTGLRGGDIHLDHPRGGRDQRQAHCTHLRSSPKIGRVYPVR